MTGTAAIHYFAAVHNVVELAKNRDPLELTDMLKSFKALMIEAIEAEQGFFEGALGDQVIASWGGISSQTPSESALHACRAALKQIKSVAADPKLGPVGLRVAIGIAEDQEMSVALCRSSLAAESSILVSAGARALCSEALRFEELSPIKDAAGRSVRVFRPS
jgi:class 3 adenylate cyclase